jgi:hypothetical protein
LYADPNEKNNFENQPINKFEQNLYAFFSYYGIDFELRMQIIFMKKLFLILLVATDLLSVSPLAHKSALALILGPQPTWGPVGYDYVDYYYLPDIETIIMCRNTSSFT